jgi:hypothetical protein
VTFYRLHRILHEQLDEMYVNVDSYTTQDLSSVRNAINECWLEIEALEAEDWWFWQQITDWNL